MSGLREPTRDVARDRHPHIELIIETLDASPEMHTPQRTFPRVITNRLEWNCNFDRVAVVCDHTLRLNYDIETEVFALSISPDSISLHTERVEIKLVSLPLVVKSIKENADIIIIKNIVSLRNIRAHLVRL